MSGVLRVCPDNPRYFTDDSGKAIYLTGSHTWNNLVDMGADYPPRPFDFAAYLDFCRRDGYNFFRLWAWELPRTACPLYPFRKRMDPFPWERTGPGLDVCGLPKFDLLRFHQPYFDRLRQRVQAAGARGIFVCVMLFEGWCAQFVPDMTPHPFFGENNVSGVAFGEDPKSIHTLGNPRILAVQEAYVRKVVDTVKDLDNVLYETANEAGGFSAAWQFHMIRLVKECETGLPRRHPVGMTYHFQGGADSDLPASGADWISPSAGANKEYWDDPPPADGRQVIVSDTDHLGGSGTGHRAWVWKSFTRGLCTLMMDRYLPPDSVTDKPYEKAEEIRRAMSHTAAFAKRMDLNRGVPRPELASTRFCLADAGREYLVYLPAGGGDELTVDLSAARGELKAEWFDPVSDTGHDAGTAAGGGKRIFRSPFPEDAVLYLRQ